MTVGILLALGSLVCWGFGDFFIQRSSRHIGVWRTLFFIGLTGLIILFPFVKGDLLGFIFDFKSLVTLLLLVVVAFFAALFDFEALKDGKMTIVEPIIGLELPIVVGLSVAVWGEQLNFFHWIFTAVIFLGVMLSITIHHTHLHYHKRIFEKGVAFAGLGAIGMALTDFLVGVASQSTSPLVAVWFMQTLLCVLSLIYLLRRGEAYQLIHDLNHDLKTVVSVSLLNNFAWMFFALATSRIPISIATTISQSYIALAVILGLFVNREKIKPHQVLGVVLAVLGIIALSLVTAS